MLYDLIMSGFGNEEDYNCAEKILYGANIAYNMDLHSDALKVSAGFGGGMYVGSKCGAVSAGIMVLSYFLNENVAHQSSKLKEMVIEFQEAYEQLNGHTDCQQLKDMYRTEREGCLKIIADAAQILDALMLRESLC